jgi:diacylglycerol kinase (ATP)
MTEHKKFSVAARIKSFKYAFEGFSFLFKAEHNAKLHLFFTGLVIVLGFIFKINALEWIAVLFAIGFVFVTEILNTCVEKICDYISPEKQLPIKRIKDLAASAVLTSAMVSVLVGLIIFLPKLLQTL